MQTNQPTPNLTVHITRDGVDHVLDVQLYSDDRGWTLSDVEGVYENGVESDVMPTEAEIEHALKEQADVY